MGELVPMGEARVIVGVSAPRLRRMVKRSELTVLEDPRDRRHRRIRWPRPPTSQTSPETP